MINKEHKDRLFCFIFGQEGHKDWTLSLYNAVNGTSYSNPEEIEITTIQDVIYMGMRNDVSFLLRWTMDIWEHQSTFNPNMPVRELMYAGSLYEKYIQRKKLNVYGSTQLKLPVPKMVVFYNGTRKQPDERILRLSDSFPKEAGEADIEVRVRMLNVNHGHNRSLMESCRVLSEYSWFIERIRNLSVNMNVEDAVDKALDEMPKDFEIRGFLMDNKAEVTNMLLTEYNEVETMELFKAEYLAEGKAAGKAEGEMLTLIKLICRKLAKGKDAAAIAEDLEEDIDRIEEICSVAKDFAPDYDPEKILEALRESEPEMA